MSSVLCQNLEFSDISYRPWLCTFGNGDIELFLCAAFLKNLFKNPGGFMMSSHEQNFWSQRSLFFAFATEITDIVDRRVRSFLLHLKTSEIIGSSPEFFSFGINRFQSIYEVFWLVGLENKSVFLSCHSQTEMISEAIKFSLDRYFKNLRNLVIPLNAIPKETIDSYPSICQNFFRAFWPLKCVGR